jgi:hypothetical protein
MATKKTNKQSMDEAENRINYMYGLGAMQQNGDRAGLAKEKKKNPELYAEWEKRHANAQNAKSSAKSPAKTAGKTSKK